MAGFVQVEVSRGRRDCRRRVTLDAKQPDADRHPCGTGARYILKRWIVLVQFLDHAELRMVVLISKNSLCLGAASTGPAATPASASCAHTAWRGSTRPNDYLAAETPALIAHHRPRRAKRRLPDLADLTPKAWAARHGQAVSRAS